MSSYPPVRTTNHPPRPFETTDTSSPGLAPAVVVDSPVEQAPPAATTRGQFLKAIAMGLGVNVLCALIPVIHILGLIFGPFFGGLAAGSRIKATPRQAVRIGIAMGIAMSILWLIIVAVLEVFFGGTANAPYQVPEWLIWLLPFVPLLWVTSLGSGGAMLGGHLEQQKQQVS